MGSFLYTALWRPYYLVDCAAMIVLPVRVKTRRQDRPTGESGNRGYEAMINKLISCLHFVGRVGEHNEGDVTKAF